MNRRAFLAAAVVAPLAPELPKRPKLERFVEAYYGVDRSKDALLLQGLRVTPCNFVPRGTAFLFDSKAWVHPDDDDT